MKMFKRSIATMLAILTLCGALSVAVSASFWRSGDFNQTAGYYTSGHTIYCSTIYGSSLTNLYVYGCNRGTGHYGACQGSGARSSGLIRVKVAKTCGWQYKDIWVSAGQSGWIDRIQTYGNVTVYLTMNTNRMCQHWALEGVSNVSWIS